MEYFDIESIAKILLVLMIFAYLIRSVKKSSSILKNTEQKIRLGRSSTSYIIVGYAAMLFLLAIGCFFEYTGVKSGDNSIRFWGIEAIILAAVGLAIVTVCAVYGRFAWLTPNGIIAPASFETRVRKFRWAIKGNVLKIYKSGQHSYKRYKIIGDAKEVEQMLEENFKPFVRRSRKNRSK